MVVQHFRPPSFSSLVAILCIKFLCMAVLVASGMIGLGPDEAQYWTWSLQPDLGYYSKPPGIAWQIAAGTFIFGQTELGARAFTLVIGFLFPILIYRLAKNSFDDLTIAWWSGLIAALSPLGFLASFLSITDGGLIIFWTLACIELAQSIRQEKSPNYIWIGALIAIGALFKWPIYILWALILCAMITLPVLRSWHYFAGLAISLLGLLPSVYWNIQHEWVTFKHVGTAIVASNPEDGATMLLKGNFADFLGSQAALLSPIWFALLAIALWKWARGRQNLTPSLQLLLYLGALPLTLYLTLSFFKKMQGNWVEFAYPALIPLIAYSACSSIKKGQAWLKAGAIVSVALILAAFSIPLIQQLLPSQTRFLPYSVNPFRHNLGWKELSHALQKSGYSPTHDFLFSDKYQTTSELYFYGEKQKKTYFFNLQGIRQNQFSFWPGMKQEQLGKNGFFAVVENEPHLSRQREAILSKIPGQLAPYFEKVEFMGEFPLFQIGGQTVKSVWIWKGTVYNGKEPPKTGKY